MDVCENVCAYVYLNENVRTTHMTIVHFTSVSSKSASVGTRKMVKCA